MFSSSNESLANILWSLVIIISSTAHSHTINFGAGFVIQLGSLRFVILPLSCISLISMGTVFGITWYKKTRTLRILQLSNQNLSYHNNSLMFLVISGCMFIKAGGIIASHFLDGRVAFIVLLISCIIPGTTAIPRKLIDGNDKEYKDIWLNVILQSLAFESGLEVTKSIYNLQSEVRIPSSHPSVTSYIQREICIDEVKNFKVLASPGLTNKRNVAHQEDGNDIVIRFDGPDSLGIKGGVNGNRGCLKFVHEMTEYDARAPLGGEQRGSFPPVALFFPVYKAVRQLCGESWTSSIEVVGVQIAIAITVSAILRSVSFEF